MSDLPHSGSIKFLADENATVALVTAIREEVVEPEAVDAAATPAEPEVAKKGKGETDAAAPAADAKADAKGDKGKK